MNPYSSGASNDTLSLGTGACNADGKATNALGFIGPKAFALTAAPYKVLSCDQVIVLDGTTFINRKDYQPRKTATFTLSLYMVNEFAQHDGKTMTNSILIQNIDPMPSKIQGAPTCIDFTDTKNMNRIVMCLPDVGTANSVLKAYVDFMKCRAGDNLKAISPLAVRRVFQAACLGIPLNISDTSDEAKIMSVLKPFLPQLGFNPAQLSKVNPAYTLRGLRVPGTLR